MTIDERISTELRRHAPEVDEKAAWERFQAGAPSKARRRAIRLVPVSVAGLGVLFIGLALFLSFPWDPAPIAALQSPFRGTWLTTVGDGRIRTMTVEVSGDGVIGIVVVDDDAPVCSGDPSTTTGTGRLQSDTVLVVPAPVLTCDDETPLERQLQDLTLTRDPESDTLTDSFGSEWFREGAEDPSPEPTAPEAIWPQSSQEEVDEAQDLADAGDPDYIWQVAPEIVGDSARGPGDAEIFTRFLTQELGWESVRWGDATTLYWGGDCATALGCTSYEVAFVRCATGQTNSLYPEDEFGGRCAPTIDEVTYETVTVSVEQLANRGPNGIWVVTDWAISQGLKQRVPRSDVEVADVLDQFLQARVDGEGADANVNSSSDTIPLLYLTSTGASYERFEYEAAPRWPTAEFDVTVRMYANDGNSVIEQQFTLNDAGDRLLLDFHGRSTIENGQPLPEPYSILDGEVTFAVPAPWYGFFDYGPNTVALVAEDGATLGVLPDPLPLETGCEAGPAPASAEALAQSILSDPDLEATEPVAASVGGISALQLDVVASADASICDSGSPEVLFVENPVSGFNGPWLEPRYRMRLYLVDLPEGSSARIVAITFVAPEAAFDTVLEYAAPILESFEFQTG